MAPHLSHTPDRAAHDPLASSTLTAELEQRTQTDAHNRTHAWDRTLTPAVPTQPLTPVQEGGRFKTWRRRFFVLSTAVQGEDATHVLRYYKRSIDANSTTPPTGAVFITKGVTKVNTVQRGRRKCIQLTTPKARRDFYVAPERDFDKWVSALTDLEPPVNAAELRRNTIGERPKPASPTLDDDQSDAEDTGDVPPDELRGRAPETADSTMSAHHTCTVLRPFCLEQATSGNAGDAMVKVGDVWNQCEQHFSFCYLFVRSSSGLARLSSARAGFSHTEPLVERCNRPRRLVLPVVRCHLRA